MATQTTETKEKAPKRDRDAGREKWVLRRHRVIMELLRYPFKLYCRLKYGYTCKVFGDRSRPYLVLYNHQTGFDQFFVGLGFKASLYYVASEDIFSIGWPAKLIRFLVNPIPIKKGTSDMRAVLTCRRVVREGGSIAIAPEGNRTYSGTTEDIRPSIAQMAKFLGLPIAFFVMRGGYGVHPRWADRVRGGHIHGEVTRVLEPEEAKAMSDEELYRLICDELWVDERENSEQNPSRHSAEGLERVLYYCPKCGDFASFSAKGKILTCKACGLAVEYGADRRFRSSEPDFPYPTVKEWYDAQKAKMSSTDFSTWGERAIFEDGARLSLVVEYKRKRPMIEHGVVRLYPDRLCVIDADGEEEAVTFPLSDVRALSCIGKNKCNIFCQNHIYQLKGDVSFNALKYVNAYYHIKNSTKEGNDKNAEGTEFLGL